MDNYVLASKSRTESKMKRKKKVAYERGPYTFTPTEGGYIVTKGSKEIGKLSFPKPTVSRFHYQTPDGEYFQTMKPAAEHMEKVGKKGSRK